MTEDRIVGCILATAVGDAIGLPYEGLSRRRAARLLGPPDRHRLAFGRGMVSDDTEHTCMVAQSLVDTDNDVVAFKRALARRMRWWLLGLPAGVGLATLRSIVRLWCGVSPDSSGVFSAGNGPAMRAAILGVAIAGREDLVAYVQASTRITHADPKAFFGALAVALAAQVAARDAGLSPEVFLAELDEHMSDDARELRELLERAVCSVHRGETTESFADSLGLTSGVSGYVYHTVPVALHACFSHPRDLQAAIMAVVRCGGDTDTTAAIVGGIVGAGEGRSGIPEKWLATLAEWPRTVAWMERLGSQLASRGQRRSRGPAIRLPVVAAIIRNVVFLIVVVGHATRRLAPPY